jgi:hypothetical protein
MKPETIEKLKKEFAKMPTVADYILALLHESGGYLKRAKLHVGLYILSRRIEELSEALEFYIETSGPRSPQVAEELVRLEAQGAIALTRRRVVLRDVEAAKAAVEKLPPSHRELVSELAELLRLATDDEALLYAYVLHGGGAEWGAIAWRLEPRRVDLAISLLSKGAASLSLAARLAGMPLSEFAEELKRRGAKPFQARVEDVDRAEGI